jgi:translation initiation factor IF-2
MAIRVHQLAREIGIDNKDLMDLLLARGFAVKSVSSTIDNISADSIRAEYEPKKPAAEAKPIESKTEETPVKKDPARPQIPGGAIVRSAGDIAKERAAREEASKPRTFPGITQPPPAHKATADGNYRPNQPPAIKFPVRASSQPPVIKFGASAAPKFSATNAPSAPAIVRPAHPPLHKASADENYKPSQPPSIKFSAGASRPGVSSSARPTPPSSVILKMPSAAPGTPSIPPSVASPIAHLASPSSVPTGEIKMMQIKPPIVVRDFALFLGLKPFKLISSLMEMGIFASMNQILEPELAVKIAEKFGILLEIKHRGESTTQPPKKKEAPKIDEKLLMEPRPAVVCVLGHVDHGKTTLVDFIRKTNVVAGEAGGITQHIGAYQIVINPTPQPPPAGTQEGENNTGLRPATPSAEGGKRITFLDTPGHSAFEKMRERGASVTDIAVLVIAADDGFKPQTEEALKHCRKHGVPVIAAITKIDMPGANIDRVKKQMQERNLLPEDWGGETITVGVNGVKGDHVNDLLEMILLQAEVLELKANPKAPAEGVIIESKIEVGRGPTATVIVQKGTLKAGDAIVCGASYCKVRSMMNERDEKLDKAGPSTPVRIIGWSEAPEVGGKFVTAKNEREAKDAAAAAAEELLKIKRAQAVADGPTNAKELLEAITAQIAKTLSVVVKADVSGSLEAIVDALNAIKSDKVHLSIIASSVGLVTLNDVETAHTAKATIVAFNTRNENGVAAQLKHHQVPVISHNIIYELVDQVKDAMADLLDPITTEHSLGKAEIRQIFALSKGSIAGTMVTEGSIFRDKMARVWRGKDIIGQGKVIHLKRQKDDASEVKAGFECGILLSGVEDFKEGDVVECYEISKIKAQL